MSYLITINFILILLAIRMNLLASAMNRGLAIADRLTRAALENNDPDWMRFLEPLVSWEQNISDLLDLRKWTFKQFYPELGDV